MNRRLLRVFLLASFCLPCASTAWGAEVTDIVDAFDYENDNPFDFHIEPTFRQERHHGIIAREAPCGPTVTPGRCDEPETVINREADYERIINAIDVGAQIGLYKDLELHITVPIVISDQRVLTYADDVGPANSRIDPSDARIEQDFNNGGFFDTYQFFSLVDGNEGPTRRGVGDVKFGLSWAPVSDLRTPWAGTFALHFDYVAPTGKPARETNSGVGRGVHELHFGLSGSRRIPNQWWGRPEVETYGVEPYFAARFVLPIPSGNSLFDDLSSSQTLVGPGVRAEIQGGLEILFFEDEETGQRYSIDLGMDFGFQAEGRDYGPLFDALGRNTLCDGRRLDEVGLTQDDGTAYTPNPDDPNVTPTAASCAWIVQEPGNATATGFDHNGITDIDSYGEIGGHFAFNIQPTEYVEVRIRTLFETETPHFLTAARTGEDRDNSGDVDFDPDRGERNPFYNPTMDGVGNRFRLESVFNIAWDVAVAVQF